MKKHNILFIMTDQFRWDAMGCSGGWINTPNLDSIANQGINFSNCITNSPVCIPARLALALGQYPHNTAMWENCRYTLSEESDTWMQRIRSAGYRTALVGKTHLHPHFGDLREREYLINAYGIDDVDETGGPRMSYHVLSHMTAEWEEKGIWDIFKQDFEGRKPYTSRPSPLGADDYYDTYVGRKSRDYLENYHDERPWFLWMSFGGPHEPWDAPEPYASMYKPEDMPEPIRFTGFGSDRPKGNLDKRLEHRQKNMTKRDIMALRANYAGNVTLIDDQIGNLIEIIKSRGEWDNTILVFTSDHGEMNGDFGLLHKFNFLNSSVKIPLIISTPEMRVNGRTGIESGALVELMDVGPTLADIAGAELDYQQFGKSYARCLTV